MNETTLTIVGNLTAEPTLRFTQGGDAVANFTVASTPRIYSKQTQSYEDGDALFVRCSVWKEQAENATNSLAKGQRVVVTGRLKQKNWEDNDGNKRSSIELDVDEIGASLRFGTASFSGTRKGTNAARPEKEKRFEDPWGSDEPPF